MMAIFDVEERRRWWDRAGRSPNEDDEDEPGELE